MKYFDYMILHIREILSDSLDMTSKVFLPTDPVDPKMLTVFKTKTINKKLVVM